MPYSNIGTAQFNSMTCPNTEFSEHYEIYTSSDVSKTYKLQLQYTKSQWSNNLCIWVSLTNQSQDDLSK